MFFNLFKKISSQILFELDFVSQCVPTSKLGYYIFGFDIKDVIYLLRCLVTA